MKIRILAFAFLLFLAVAGFSKDLANDAFAEGATAYASGDFASAVQAFQKSAAENPSTGTLLNLGLAQWRRGRAGAAVQAWEQVMWIDPANRAARQNLHFARQVAQLESPDLNWYESVSTWLSAKAWAWLAAISFWGAMAMIVLPRVLRWRKGGWSQAMAASALTVFILTLPAQAGIISRSRIGFVLERNAQLRLTPTDEAEVVSSLTIGEPIRQVTARGDFVFVRTAHGVGWVKRAQLGMVCSR